MKPAIICQARSSGKRYCGWFCTILGDRGCPGATQPIEQPVRLARDIGTAPGDVGIRPHDQHLLRKTKAGFARVHIDQLERNAAARSGFDHGRGVERGVETQQRVARPEFVEQRAATDNQTCGTRAPGTVEAVKPPML